MNYRFLLFLIAAVYLSSCAGTYQASNPGSFNYKTVQVNEEQKISYAYIFDIFEKRGFHKYARKEKHKGVNMVAVKITNNSEQTIDLTPDHFSVASTGMQTLLYAPDEFYKIIRQQKGFYFFWLIGNPTFTTTSGGGTITGNSYSGYYYTPPTTHVYGIPLGTGLAFLNFFIAKHANKVLKADLKQNQLIGKSVEPGGSAYGYIYMQKPPDRNITISLK